jgi:hypothetical protein
MRDPQDLRQALDRALRDVRITDIHTHLYAPCFGDLLLWGVDELLTYHYLVAEFFRQSEMAYADFWKLPKKEQADAIWKALFLDHSPLSEACRGVLTALRRLGLDVARRDLGSYRAWFAGQSRDAHIDRVFAEAGIRDCVMTNDPFDDQERPVWLERYRADFRFKAALRVDPILLGWEKAFLRLREWGYRVDREISPFGEATADARLTIDEVKRFLRDWEDRTEGLYVGVSLPPTFSMPDPSPAGVLLEQAVLPVCQEYDLPVALMIGVKRRVNPELALAGDGVGRSRIEAVEYLCAKYPKNKFMVTMLARENQHELCVAARKFRNLLVFGCWWFVNNPSIIGEITRERIELLGPGMLPQHSDARVLDQVLYKWDHSKKVIGEVLFEKYSDLLATGWTLDEREIARDVEGLFGGNFWTFLKRRL